MKHVIATLKMTLCALLLGLLIPTASIAGDPYTKLVGKTFSDGTHTVSFTQPGSSTESIRAILDGVEYRTAKLRDGEGRGLYLYLIAKGSGDIQPVLIVYMVDNNRLKDRRTKEIFYPS